MNGEKPSLGDPRARLARASEHLHTLGEAIQEYLDGDPHAVEHERIDEGFVFRLAAECPPPLRLGAIFGDLVHNLRVALDNLAWQLVLLNGERPGRNTGFPIARDQAGFDDWGRSRIKGMAETHIQMIEAIQPFAAPDNPRTKALDAVALHDNLDKHRAVHPFFATPSRSQLPFDIRREPIESEFQARIEITGFGQALTDGSEIARMTFAADSPQPVIDVTGSFRLDVAFGEKGIAARALPVLARQISDVVESFAAEFDEGPARVTQTDG